MARGIPKVGYRVRAGKKIYPKAAVTTMLNVSRTDVQFAETTETDDQIRAKLNERFTILQMLTNSAISGETRALIVSGPAGLGKSFTVEEALKAWDPEADSYTIIKGFVKATGLYKLLYQFRNKNNVIVFDDADSIFADDVALNMLKAVCDTTEERKVSYLAEYDMVDEKSGELIPRTFTFNGTIVFISNIDFDAQIDKGTKLAPHMTAMMSRAHYIDLAMKSRRDYVIRIQQVVEAGMLTQRGLNTTEAADVMHFITTNSEKLRELSLRMAIKLADLRKAQPAMWEKMARVTCMKNA